MKKKSTRPRRLKKPGRAGTGRTGTRAGLLKALVASQYLAALEGDDLGTWLVCYRGTLTGVFAAQRQLPNPRMIVRYCASAADCAFDEVVQRRRARVVIANDGVEPPALEER